jgi:hypothetical protein
MEAATMAPVGEMSADELAAAVRAGEQDEIGAERARKELERRAHQDGEEEAAEVLNGLLEEEQAELDAGGEIEASSEVLDGDAPPSYADELAAAREAEGLDAKTSLPTAADDSGSDPQNLAIAGDGQLSWSVGGKKPTSSKLRLTGGAFEVEGAIPKGTLITVEVQARVGGVAFDDTVDPKTTQATSCTRNHKARIVGAVRVEKGTVDRLDELVDAVQAFLGSGSSEDEQALRALVAPVE